MYNKIQKYKTKKLNKTQKTKIHKYIQTRKNALKIPKLTYKIANSKYNNTIIQKTNNIKIQNTKIAVKYKSTVKTSM